jgi:hypothetical protein
MIQWTPADLGTFDVTVRVVNSLPFGQTGEDTQNYTIDVVSGSSGGGGSGSGGGGCFISSLF